MANKFHLTDDGPKECGASLRRCKYGTMEEHLDSLSDAWTAYNYIQEAKNPNSLKGVQKNSLTRQLLKENEGNYPPEILQQLGEYLSAQPYRTLSIVPSGSGLYNTVVPGKPVHDYDFVVFATPHPKLRKIKQHLAGELDVMAIDVSSLLNQEYMRSTSIIESLYAAQSGRHSLYQNTDDPWSSFTSSVRVPVHKYFDVVHDVCRSHYENFIEPVTQDKNAQFRAFKHFVRWNIYQKRWADGKVSPMDNYLDPELSAEERKTYVHALGTGWADSIFDDIK